MTSTLRKFSQMDPRTKYLIMNATITAWSLKDGYKSSPLMEVNAFKDAFDTSSKTLTFANTSDTNTLLDLGRQITVYDASVIGSPHIAVFREVLFRGDEQFYICVNILKYDENYEFAIANVSRLG